VALAHDIDVLENSLRRRGDLLDTLLLDRTTRKNIVWATDSYESYGKGFRPKDQIRKEFVTGKYGTLIQPRAAKPLSEQKQRTRDKAEVFTPLPIVKKINRLVDWPKKRINESSWKNYVSEIKLEISCGEAPFIVSRYDPVAQGNLIPFSKRVGFLDQKLRVVTEYCDTPREWLKWARIAYKASYGYEWQGDNILIARENLLYTLIDYYQDKFKTEPSLTVLKSFADIISWNIFQMDGIKYVVPMSCKHEERVIPGELTIFGETPDKVEKDECEGCKFNRPTKHNGKYAKVMDWETSKQLKFIELLSQN
jgi:hypothetical protein